MARFELIDKETYTIYEFDNSIDICNDWSIVACLTKFDQYNERITQLIYEIVQDKELYNCDKQELLYKLQKRLIQDIEKVKENERNGEM